MSNSNANTFKILVATDNHLGYLEKDSERGDDSFNTFEEILKIAVDENVDFILLGGDLFHENKPSRRCILKCMELLRKYTFGERPVHFNFISDPTENFPHLRNPVVNYQDPNLNVSIPVFSIHGNHDDPAGLGQHSAMEVLSTAGLVNYFGRVNNLNEVRVSPLLMTKGDARLAIFGLSSLKDERLFRLFKENKVKFMRPNIEKDNWFSLLVLHQNHTKHSTCNYIPEEFLDDFFDLVIWGHEHECRLEAKESTHGAFYVTQPGSSVATSLCAGEAVPKHVAVLSVKEAQQMKIVGKRLQTVRPFVFKDLCLKEFDLPDIVGNRANHPIEKFVEERVEELIEEAKQQLTGHPKQPVKPLIRLRVEYTHESQMFNVVRFGHKFEKTVANFDSILLFRKYRDVKKEENGDIIDQDLFDSLLNNESANVTRVEDLVEQYFAELDGEANQMQLLSERGLAFSVGRFIDKDEKEAVEAMFSHQVEKTVKHLTSLRDLDIENIEEQITKFHIERLSKKEDIEESIAALSAASSRPRTSSNSQDEDFDSDLDSVDVPVSSGASRRGGRGGRRGRGAGRGSRGGNVNGTSSDTRTSPLEKTRASSRAKRARLAPGVGARGRNRTIVEAFSRSSSRSSRGIEFMDISD